jgi:tRNA threonylcarbamoyladenosine biosynthesis protein TsaE
MKKVITKSLEETQNFAKKWLDSLAPSEDGAVVVGLYGNLGAGKTTFTQAVAREMDVKDIVNSPTFVIEKIYETKHPIFKRLIHIDAYRLAKASELQVLNFEELIENKNNLILIEWPENVKEILPADHHKIYCEFVDENSRQFEVQ